jgi:GntR family transcriptional regulator/MocR family aminotransferase
MRLLYGQRRTALVDGLRQQFGSTLEILGAEAGMHLVVILPKGFRDAEIANKAARERLWLWPLSPTYLGETPRQGLILGFGSTPAADMPHALGRLGDMLDSA